MLVGLVRECIVEGLPIVSVTQRSNAVVFSVEGSSVQVLTDYGNRLSFDFKQLQKGYKVHEEYLEGYPIEPLYDRLTQQIELLTEARGLLKRVNYEHDGVQ